MQGIVPAARAGCARSVDPTAQAGLQPAATPGARSTDHIDRLIAHEVDLSADDVVERGPGTAIGHAADLCPYRTGEQHTAQMGRRAYARIAERQLFCVLVGIRDEAAELTGVLSGCYDAVRSLRHSAELDQDVVITLRATENSGDVFFLATFEPLGIVIHGYDFGIQQTASICESLSASFDKAIGDFDDQVYVTRLMRQLNG